MGAIAHLPDMTSVAPWWAALLLAALVASGAFRARTLRPDGAVAAFIIGAAALRAQWAWGIYLIGWFVLASGLSRIGRTRKQQRTAGMIAKSDQRDLRQVLANGGLFGACALLAIAFNLGGNNQATIPTTLAIIAAGALAAAGADTWATEIGTWIGGTPFSLREWTRVARGSSGAVTVSGTLASVAGAILLAGMAASVDMIPLRGIAAVAVGGIVGACADTLLGAWVQERRWCARCEMPTEQPVHQCGTNTCHRGGLPRLGNDMVNALCSIIGGIVSGIWWTVAP